MGIKQSDLDKAISEFVKEARRGNYAGFVMYSNMAGSYAELLNINVEKRLAELNYEKAEVAYYKNIALEGKIRGICQSLDNTLAEVVRRNAVSAAEAAQMLGTTLSDFIGPTETKRIRKIAAEHGLNIDETIGYQLSLASTPPLAITP